MKHSISVPDNWYETFFTAPINAFWEAIVPESVTQQEVAFVERHLQLKAGARVLDVPCGAGRHSLALARRGLALTGVDIASDAIHRARATASAEKLAVYYLHHDMRCLQVEGQFDGAICMGNSFGYLTHTDTQSFLRSVHNCLRAGARLIMDSGMTAESILPNMERKATYQVSDYIFELENDYDIARSRLLTRTVLRRGDAVWEQSFSHAVYTCGELARMFDDAGFNVIARLADLEEKPYCLGDQRLLLVVERR